MRSRFLSFMLGVLIAAVAIGGLKLWLEGGLDSPSGLLEKVVPLQSGVEAAPDPEPPAVAPQPTNLRAPGKLGAPPAARDRYPHIEPLPGRALGEVASTFLFEGKSYRVAVDVNEELYWGAAASDRSISRPVGESDTEVRTAFYRYLIQDPRQAPLIAKLAKKLRKQAERAGLDRDRYAEFIAKYVQSFPYDYAKIESADTTTRFPVQTIVEGTGVCGDKSALLAALLAHEGYKVALLEFAPEKHMAVGIKGPGETYPASGYLFVESTGPTYLSEIPKEYIGGIQLESTPLVIPIGTGKTKYGSADDVARIIAARASSQEAAQALYAEANGSALSPQEAAKVNAKLQQANEAQFRLQRIKDRETDFLDREPALRWIAKNCWWD